MPTLDEAEQQWIFTQVYSRLIKTPQNTKIYIMSWFRKSDLQNSVGIKILKKIIRILRITYPNEHIFEDEEFTHTWYQRAFLGNNILVWLFVLLEGIEVFSNFTMENKILIGMPREHIPPVQDFFYIKLKNNS